MALVEFTIILYFFPFVGALNVTVLLQVPFPPEILFVILLPAIETPSIVIAIFALFPLAPL